MIGRWKNIAALALQFLPDLSPLFMSTTFSFSDASSSCRKHVFEDQVATTTYYFGRKLAVGTN